MKYIVMAVLYLVLSSCQQRTYSFNGLENEGIPSKKPNTSKKVYHFK